MLQKDIESINFPLQNESMICKGYIQTHDNKLEKMFVEDLAALEPLSDDALLDEIKNRLKRGDSYSFIGDVLLSMNPNKQHPIYDRKVRSFLLGNSILKALLSVPFAIHVQVAVR